MKLKRKIVGLFCILLFAFGCATINPCAPLLDTPVVLEQFTIQPVGYIIRVHDTDGDGVGDTMAVYIQKQGSTELVEYFQKPLTEEEVVRANEIIKGQEAREKANSQ